MKTVLSGQSTVNHRPAFIPLSWSLCPQRGDIGDGETFEGHGVVVGVALQ